MNAFDSLCILASKEKWCWKLYCTTCGTMHFRYALVEIAKGNEPDNIGWVIHSNKAKYSVMLGALPRLFNHNVKKDILKICESADITFISNNCQFPDWLGYLGFVLKHVHTNGNEYKIVSDSWVSQLLTLVPKDSISHKRLLSIESKNECILVEDLEIIENDMLMLNYV